MGGIKRVGTDASWTAGSNFGKIFHLHFKRAFVIRPQITKATLYSNDACLLFLGDSMTQIFSHSQSRHWIASPPYVPPSSTPVNPRRSPLPSTPAGSRPHPLHHLSCNYTRRFTSSKEWTKLNYQYCLFISQNIPFFFFLVLVNSFKCQLRRTHFKTKLSGIRPHADSV